MNNHISLQIIKHKLEAQVSLYHSSDINEQPHFTSNHYT